MKLVCPCCGGVASREAWENDPVIRQFEAIVLTLPHKVQSHVTHYLGMFRKGERGLAWKRALRLLQDLRDLVAPGTVQWEGGEVRPAPPELWAEVMEYMIGRSDIRELDDHNYLRKTAWSKARPLAAQGERAREEAAKHRAREPERGAEAGEPVDIKDLFEGFKRDPKGFAQKLKDEREK